MTDAGQLKPGQISKELYFLEFQLPKAQALVFFQYCEIHDLNTDTVVLAALCAMIRGLEDA